MMSQKPVLGSYDEIFARRAKQYHQAMTEQPGARRHEFEGLAGLVDAGHCRHVLDIPSGGGYLRPYLPAGVVVTSLDFSTGFPAGVGGGVRQAGYADFPCADASFDHVLSLTGLHHLPDVPGFLRECCRVLEPGGRLVIGEVRAGSGVAAFLNEFVDRHNSMGHRGRFLDEGFVGQLEAQGFNQVRHELQHYPWVFADATRMADFCTKLFGIDRAGPAEVLAGLADYLGYRQTSDGVGLDWELIFFVATKPAVLESRPA
jgi:SAM-dependent methyltransferase